MTSLWSLPSSENPSPAFPTSLPACPRTLAESYLFCRLPLPLNARGPHILFLALIFFSLYMLLLVLSFTPLIF